MTPATYTGRLACDGQGNLLADEGEHKGLPVAYHEGSYVFVNAGEPSHNERHHQQYVDMFGTQDVDENAPGYAGTPDNPTEGCEHHWGPTEDDAHYDADADNNTRLRNDADRVAATITGHTEAYRG